MRSLLPNVIHPVYHTMIETVRRDRHHDCRLFIGLGAVDEFDSLKMKFDVVDQLLFVANAAAGEVFADSPRRPFAALPVPAETCVGARGTVICRLSRRSYWTLVIVIVWSHWVTLGQ